MIWTIFAVTVLLWALGSDNSLLSGASFLIIAGAVVVLLANVLGAFFVLPRATNR